MSLYGAAQLVGIVGAGILAQSTARFFGAPGVYGWFSEAIAIGTVSLSMIIAQAVDYWGRKWILVGTAMCGIIGSLIISRAENIATVIAGFCVLGLSYGTQATLSAVVSEVLPRKHRGLGQAAISMSAGASSIVGCLVGGALLNNDDADAYRVYWYITAGLFTISTTAILFCYNPSKRELQLLSLSAKVKQLDWFAAVIILTGLPLFCISLEWSGNPYAWNDAHILAPFIIGISLLAAFSMYEWKFKADGFLHHSMFKDRNLALACIASAMEGLSFFTTNIFLSFEASVLGYNNPFEAGQKLMMTFLISIFAASISGFFITRTRKTKEPLLAGFACLVVYNALMASIKPSSSPNVFWGYPVVAGVGVGVILPTVVVVTQMAAPQEHISLATALSYTFRSLGGAIGVAVNNAIFNNTLSKNLGTRIAAAVLPLGFPASNLGALITAFNSGSLTAIQNVPHISDEILGAGGAAFRESYALAFRYAWIAAACFSAVGIICKSPSVVRVNREEF
jgi:MFS family permease